MDHYLTKSQPINIGSNQTNEMNSIGNTFNVYQNFENRGYNQLNNDQFLQSTYDHQPNVCNESNLHSSSIQSDSGQFYSASQNSRHMWAHNIPNVMPWSYEQDPQYVSKFSFSSDPNAVSSQSLTQSTSNPMASSFGCWTPASSPSETYSLFNSSLPSSPTSSPSVSLFYNNFNQNNKRHIEVNFDQGANYDFDTQRPIKKYICEEKVLEIFDRMHIREGEHYIVEDAAENNSSMKGAATKHNVVIEELDDDKDHIVELSPELKSAFKTNPDIVGDKLLQLKNDKLSKAVILWQPNTIYNSLLSSTDVDKIGDNESVKECAKVEEALSDDEEMSNDNNGCECDNLVIEQINDDDNDELMEEA